MRRIGAGGLTPILAALVALVVIAFCLTALTITALT